jgi:hypothetical protein
VIPVIREYHVPTSIDDKVFKDLQAHHVPIPAELIRATRKHHPVGRSSIEWSGSQQSSFSRYAS